MKLKDFCIAYGLKRAKKEIAEIIQIIYFDVENELTDTEKLEFSRKLAENVIVRCTEDITIEKAIDEILENVENYF